VLGSPSVEPKDRSVRVAARNAIPAIAEDELVYARVDELKTAMAICTILSTASNPRGIPGTPEGTVHVSKVKDGYTETLSGEFAVGDLILARILQAHPSVKLTTAASSLGVVAARCQLCHALLTPSGKELVCPRCGHREHRKLATGSLAGTPGRRDGDAH
jgi:exosome complex RNA-binding protein Csl4